MDSNTITGMMKRNREKSIRFLGNYGFDSQALYLYGYYRTLEVNSLITNY